MIRELQITLFDLIACLSEAIDLVSPEVANHHNQVAYIALNIGEELGLPVEQLNELVMAGALHDVGGLSLKERLGCMEFEIENPSLHSELGYQLLKKFEPFSGIAHLVQYHHVARNTNADSGFKGEDVPFSCHILHLADRVAVLVDRKKEILGQVKTICEKVEEQTGEMFKPELAEAFVRVAARGYFWFSLASQSIGRILYRRLKLATIELDMDGVLGLTKLFSEIIDFRSAFTATHSSGVAASSESIAEFIGFSQRECCMMRIAGYLHDLGKLAVPSEILQKHAKLTNDEFNIIRCHTFHTHHILERIADLEVINTWASFHHERLDGRGYPFQLKAQNLSLGSRIMAVADVFTAITEDRPYRKAMPSDRALEILLKMANASVLDPKIVSVLRLHFDEINSLREAAQVASVVEYRQFIQSTE